MNRHERIKQVTPRGAGRELKEAKLESRTKRLAKELDVPYKLGKPQRGK